MIFARFVPILTPAGWPSLGGSPELSSHGMFLQKRLWDGGRAAGSLPVPWVRRGCQLPVDPGEPFQNEPAAIVRVATLSCGCLFFG